MNHQLISDIPDGHIWKYHLTYNNHLYPHSFHGNLRPKWWSVESPERQPLINHLLSRQRTSWHEYRVTLNDSKFEAIFSRTFGDFYKKSRQKSLNCEISTEFLRSPAMIRFSSRSISITVVSGAVTAPSWSCCIRGMTCPWWPRRDFTRDFTMKNDGDLANHGERIGISPFGWTEFSGCLTAKQQTLVIWSVFERVLIGFTRMDWFWRGPRGLAHQTWWFFFLHVFQHLLQLEIEARRGFIARAWMTGSPKQMVRRGQMVQPRYIAFHAFRQKLGKLTKIFVGGSTHIWFLKWWEYLWDHPPEKNRTPVQSGWSLARPASLAMATPEAKGGGAAALRVWLEAQENLLVVGQRWNYSWFIAGLYLICQL